MKDIIWNQSATEDYHDNIDYLLKKWTEREALFFMDEVESQQTFPGFTRIICGKMCANLCKLWSK